MNRHCIPGLTMSTALTGNFSAGVSGIIKTMHTGFGCHYYTCAYTFNARCTTGRNGRYDLAWKDLCSVPDALQ